MKTTYTQGPWTVPTPLVTGRELPFTPVFASTLIAKVYSTNFGNHEQSLANANLIAAAPDLLRALYDFIGCAERCELLLRESRPDDANALCEQIAKSIVAIAKATGKGEELTEKQ